MWMEHPAAMDVAGMEAAGVTMDDICFYQVRVRAGPWGSLQDEQSLHGASGVAATQARSTLHLLALMGLLHSSSG